MTRAKTVIARYGVVSLEQFNRSYRLRFTHLGKRICLYVGMISKDRLKVAIAKAQQIDSDLTFERFDPTLAKYSPKHAQQLIRDRTPPKQPTLLSLWKQYKKCNQHKVCKTTQAKNWKQADRCLEKVNPENLELINAHLIIPNLFEHYSQGTLNRVFIDLNACLNWAVESGLIEKNPYKFKSKRKIKQINENDIFTPQERDSIIEAFKNNEFQSKYSVHKHSHYASFVEFLFLVGCRPQDAIALTWDDIIEHQDRSFIRFNKAYSFETREVKSTKNNKTRLFPINSQLNNLLETTEKIPNPNNLIFPSQEGVYIDVKLFNRRYWKPVVNGLVAQGKVRFYRYLYYARHTFITSVIRLTNDIASVGMLVETSPEMIMNHYLIANPAIVIPEL